VCIGIVAAQATPLAATKIPNATKRMPRQLTQSQTNCRADALDHSAFRHSQFSLARRPLAKTFGVAQANGAAGARAT